MTTHKKLGLLLVPLVPLAAIGIVELARQITVPDPTTSAPSAASEAPAYLVTPSTGPRAGMDG